MGINTSKIPIIPYGTIEDIDTWLEAGTINVTSSQNDPYGGTNAQLLEAATSGARAYIEPTLLENDGHAQFAATVKAGTATSSLIRLRDMTAGVNRIQANLTWTGGVPAVTASAGTFIGSFVLGDGWYVIMMTGTGIVVSNTNEFSYFPGSGVGTGTMLVYDRPIVVLPLALDNARAFAKPRRGSEKILGASGIEDAWVIDDDYFLTGELRWITSRMTATPEAQSGWEGAAERSVVNVGVESWLRHAWGANSFLWVPDRTNSLTSHSAYLETPFIDEEPAREENDTRRLPIRLRHTNAVAFRGY